MSQISFPLSRTRSTTGVAYYLRVLRVVGSTDFKAKYTDAALGYLWSLVKLQPDIIYLAAMPFMVKLHIVMAYLIIGIAPFTRLVHILVVPNPYLWRKPQVVRWYRRADASVVQRQA